MYMYSEHSDCDEGRLVNEKIYTMCDVYSRQCVLKFVIPTDSYATPYYHIIHVYTMYMHRPLPLYVTVHVHIQYLWSYNVHDQ